MKTKIDMPNIKVYDTKTAETPPEFVYARDDVDSIIRDLLIERETYHKKYLESEVKYYKTISRIASEELKRLEDESLATDEALDVIQNALGGRV